MNVCIATPFGKRVLIGCFISVLALSLLFGAKERKDKESAFSPSGRPEYDALLALHQTQGTAPEVRRYLSKTIAKTSRNLQRAMESCTDVGPNSSWPRMMVILKLDSAGIVKEARADSESPLAMCLEKSWLGKKFKKPPFAPFYRLVVINAWGSGGV